jgi:biofilm PGA synthesis N-glycosyltransferase PgaC
MEFWIIVFVASCFVVFYNYAGYAVLVFFINQLKKRKRTRPDFVENFPTVSFIVAAYNEESCIEKKILDSLRQDYPPEKIEFLFITDGSTDSTASIVSQYTAVQLLHQAERKGKSAAINRAVLAARNDILIFSDANTFLNPQATKKITRHYADERVGGVAGEKKVISVSESPHEVGAGEGLYWKYESFLKRIDSEFYSVVGAAGELFSLRKNLFEPVPDTVILDDFIISMRIAGKGYRIVYEPEAFAMELPSFSIRDEQKRKVRIAAGGFQAMGMLRSILRFWKHPRLSFLYVSHRVLRWTLSPLCLILAFISNLILFIDTDLLVFKVLFAGQLAFYGMAIASGLTASKNNSFKVMRLAYYFVFMNVSVVQGFFRFLRGKQPSAWEKAARNQPVLQAK